MHKIMITKKAFKYLKHYYAQICFNLFEGFSIQLVEVFPVKNKIKWVKYYKCVVEADYSSQKEVVEAFKFVGLIKY